MMIRSEIIWEEMHFLLLMEPKSKVSWSDGRRGRRCRRHISAGYGQLRRAACHTPSLTYLPWLNASIHLGLSILTKISNAILFGFLSRFLSASFPLLFKILRDLFLPFFFLLLLGFFGILIFIFFSFLSSLPPPSLPPPSQSGSSRFSRDSFRILCGCSGISSQSRVHSWNSIDASIRSLQTTYFESLPVLIFLSFFQDFLPDFRRIQISKD